MFKLSADQGYDYAQYAIGYAHQLGLIGPQDFKEAIRWYKLAVGQGNVEAQFKMAQLYETEKSLMDYKEALKLYKLAAKQGHTQAEFCLGHMYAKGKGVSKNYKEAVRLYRIAAKKGYRDAQYYLGLMYADGTGLEQDFINAYMWWDIAYTNGFFMAKKSKRNLSRKMTESQIEEAEKLSKKAPK